MPVYRFLNERKKRKDLEEDFLQYFKAVAMKKVFRLLVSCNFSSFFPASQKWWIIDGLFKCMKGFNYWLGITIIVVNNCSWLALAALLLFSLFSLLFWGKHWISFLQKICTLSLSLSTMYIIWLPFFRLFFFYFFGLFNWHKLDRTDR